MQKFDALLGLLNRKGEAFLRYEALTVRLLDCPAEELEEKLRCRQTLIVEIDAISAQIGEAIGDLGPQGTLAEQTLRLQVQREELPTGLWPLFDAGLSQRGILGRIERMDELAADRLEEELDRLTEKIKENNRGAGAQAAKYHMALMPDSSRGALAGPLMKA